MDEPLVHVPLSYVARSSALLMTAYASDSA